MIHVKKNIRDSFQFVLFCFVFFFFSFFFGELLMTFKNQDCDLEFWIGVNCVAELK